MSLSEYRRLLRVFLEDRVYHLRAKRKGLVYDEAAICSRMGPRARLLDRAVAEGNLRIFAAFRHHRWERHNLIPALEKLGEVVHFDWGEEGFPPDRQWTPEDKRAMNRLMLDRLAQAEREGKFHLFFGYLSGRTTTPETIRKIGERGIVTVNLGLDDRAKFISRRKHGAWLGNCDIAPAFDLSCTSTESALEKYLVAGGNPLFMPEGANPDVYRPMDVEFEHDVTFVGQCYGMRPHFVDELRGLGVKVETFGYGWPNGPVDVDEMVAMYSKSRINLGFGGVGVTRKLVCLKGRDFEVPMCGGLYATQYNPELERVYRVGEEIVCYRDARDLAAKIKFLLAHPHEAERIRRAGHARAVREHTWESRFRHMLACMLGKGDGAAPGPQTTERLPSMAEP